MMEQQALLMLPNKIIRATTCKAIRTMMILVFGAILSLSVCSPVRAEHIALMDGDLKIQQDGRIINITGTNGKINRFLMSPNDNHVAYEITVRFVPEHNDAPELDNEIREVPVSDIEIYDLLERRIVARITPPVESCEFVRMDGWVSENEFLLHDADGIAVCSSYVYDISKKELKEIGYEEYDKKRETTIK